MGLSPWALIHLGKGPAPLGMSRSAVMSVLGTVVMYNAVFQGGDKAQASLGSSQHIESPVCQGRSQGLSSTH